MALLALVCDIVLSASLAIFLSAVNVYLRDVQHLIEVLLVALFFSPPIVYQYVSVADKLSRPSPLVDLSCESSRGHRAVVPTLHLRQCGASR